MRRYNLTTFGCQMNAHDSERIKGLLEELGLGESPTPAEADVIVFNTCTIREKPDQRLAAHLAQARALKEADPGRVIAVGGCYAEAQREHLFERYPFVDVAFGPGSIPHLADWLGAGGYGAASGAEQARRPEAATEPGQPEAATGHVARGRFAEWKHFAGHLPARRERPFQAWVQISMGCNSKCSYCIVPAVRGRERSRELDDVLGEVASLADDGVCEVTLLGQNVNSWGRDLTQHGRVEFGALLRAVDEIDGIERIRFTSPHPKDFRQPVIDAMAECAAVCEHTHLPAQSGSTDVLKRMRRTYSRERYVELATRMRAQIPDLALSTDLMVGFPGERDTDFAQTLSLVDQVGFDSAFTFVFSPRPSTEAAELPGQVSEEQKAERIERLVDAVQATALARNEMRVGGVEEVLVEGTSRTDSELLRGRSRRNTTVNFAGTTEPGQIVNVAVTSATSTTLLGAEVGHASAHERAAAATA